MSSLADRIKIARNGQGQDINLSIQFLLNCGSDAGSCHGGSAIRAYQFINDKGYIPYDTCAPYLACSNDSTNGICPHVDTTCTPRNICLTCQHPQPGQDNGGVCTPIGLSFPNATVAEYGNYDLNSGLFAIQAEIFLRGPVKASVNAGPLLQYRGGIMLDSAITRNSTHNHGVSIVGWGHDATLNVPYWIVRNSWGEYWGGTFCRQRDELDKRTRLYSGCISLTSLLVILTEMGFFRVELGKNLLGIESHISWAIPGAFTVSNFPCLKDGSNCVSQQQQYYVDPSKNADITIQRRLRQALQ
jgi:cathepsin X